LGKHMIISFGANVPEFNELKVSPRSPPSEGITTLSIL
jgi:hypothetical protein